MSTGSSSPQTVSDLYGEATGDDTTVAADQKKLAADQSQATLDHQGLTSAVTTLGLVVIPNADGSFTVLEPDGSGGVKQRTAVGGSAPIPPSGPVPATSPAPSSSSSSS